VSKKEVKQQKKGKAPKEAPEAAPQEPGKKAKGPRGPSEPSRLRVRYSKEIVPALMKHFNYTNVMAVPKLEKIVINMGLGEAVANAKVLDVAAGELGQIAGQRPVITRAKKSIANFKLRQNMPIGAAVTLRGERMFEFLDRLTNVVLPRVRDFRGVSMKSFDGRGNYTLGLRDQLIFPEIPYEKVDKIRGMNVTIVTTARTDDEARELLKQLGMPFRQ
jgi:large subunit ribosomal protein L5